MSIKYTNPVCEKRAAEHEGVIRRASVIIPAYVKELELEKVREKLGSATERIRLREDIRDFIIELEITHDLI